MNEQLSQLFVLARGIWRYRWYGLLTAWLVAAIGLFVVYNAPQQYEASARLQVDSDSLLRPLLRDLTVETDVSAKLANMTRVLKSRPILERIAKETDLALRAENEQQMQELLSKLQEKIVIDMPLVDRRHSDTDALFYTVSFRDKDPEMARDVVQTVVDFLVEGALGANRYDTDAAEEFLVKQIREYEKRLADSEQRLAEFKKEHVGLMPSQGGGYYERLQTEISELEDLKSQLALARKRKQTLEQQLSGESPILGEHPELASIKQEIERHKDSLESLLLKYTEEHPDVVAERQTLAQLEARKERVAEDAKATIDMAVRSENDNVQVNPVYQEVKIALGETEVEISTLEERIREKQARIDRLHEMVDTIPEVEAKLARLNRDYAVTQQRHEALVSRLESARLSQEAGQSSSDVKFRIIDPPIVPLEPAGPGQLVFAAGVLLAALGAAVGVMFGLYWMHPVFLTTEEVTKATGFPVLGRVSLIRNRKQRRRQALGLASFYTLGVLLLVSFGAATYMMV